MLIIICFIFASESSWAFFAAWREESEGGQRRASRGTQAHIGDCGADGGLALLEGVV